MPGSSASGRASLLVPAGNRLDDGYRPHRSATRRGQTGADIVPRRDSTGAAGHWLFQGW